MTQAYNGLLDGVGIRRRCSGRPHRLRPWPSIGNYLDFSRYSINSPSGKLELPARPAGRYEAHLGAFVPIQAGKSLYVRGKYHDWLVGMNFT